MKKYNVLSLFNGMSCGYIALSELGFEINKYYVSEVDKHANKIAELIYPESIFLGDVRKIDVAQLETIDIVLAGFPCTDLSFAGKKSGLICEGLDEYMELREEYLQTNDENLYFYNGKFQQSILFYEFLRIWNDVKKINPNALFLVENVKMKQTEELKISKLLGMHPISINAKLVSAQSRDRLFWTNIANKPLGMFGDIYIDIPQPKDKGIYLKDILEDQVDEKYFLSEKIVQGFLKHKERHKEKGTGFGFKPKTEQEKGNCLRANAAICPTDNLIITHNLQQRSGKGKGGKGHLSKTDQKSYCLDTGNSQGLEIIGYINDNTSQANRVYNPNGKSSTLVGNAGGGGAKTGLYQIKSNIRRLTPREAGRLQSVPEPILDLMLNSGVSDTQLYRLFGNGWCIEVIKHILNFI
jgi:DNA (cytosine-5)-methyltransferase 3A